MNIDYDITAKIYQKMYLDEAIHPEILQTLENVQNKHYRYSEMTKKIRTLIAQNQDTGLTDDKPKKGSSRAVMFSKEPMEVRIDGEKTTVPYVLKVAFSGALDKYRQHDSKLLGQLQNEHEINYGKSDYAFNWSPLRKVGEDDYVTNKAADAFLPPIFDHDADHNWMTVGKITPITADAVRSITKHSDFKKGLSIKDIHDALVYHHDVAHGIVSAYDSRLDDLIFHPKISSIIDFCSSTNTQPDDFKKRNLGIWQHPITKENHLVASDAGYSEKVMNAYRSARRAMLKNRY